MNFYSKQPKNVLINTSLGFIKRVLNQSDKKFEEQNKKIIWTTLKKNCLPNYLIRNLFKKYEERKNNNGDNAEKNNHIYKSLTYVPRLSEAIKNGPFYDKNKYNIAYRSHNNNKQFFSNMKSKIKNEDKYNLVYKINCKGNDIEDCNGIYIGTTGNKLKTRLSGHKSNFKKLKDNKNKTALALHCYEKNHTPDFEGVKIIAQENNYNKRLLTEMLKIIEVPCNLRINAKADVDNIAQSYRNVIINNRECNKGRRN